MAGDLKYSMADYSPPAGQISILFPGGCRARSQLHNSIRYVSVRSKLMKSLSSVEEVSLLPLEDFYPMADFSTPAAWIPIPFAGGGWARSQPHNGIQSVSVT